MAENKMLIDATHPEETRVVVLRNGRVEEFDYESAARKLLRGSIFLAKVTRVEPSLQAAFVDYGGNRHGFLAFNEIHTDYYQIPHSDRLALLEEEMSHHYEDDGDDDFILEDTATITDEDKSDEKDISLDAVQASDDDDAHAGAHEFVEDNGGDDWDDDDIEANAIDVSDLLPPVSDEQLSYSVEIETGTAAADLMPDGQQLQSATNPGNNKALSLAAGEAGETELDPAFTQDAALETPQKFLPQDDHVHPVDDSAAPVDKTDGESTAISQNHDNAKDDDNESSSDPRTMAAETSRDERIVSEVIELAVEDVTSVPAPRQTQDEIVAPTDESETGSELCDDDTLGKDQAHPAHMEKAPSEVELPADQISSTVPTAEETDTEVSETGAEECPPLAAASHLDNPPIFAEVRPLIDDDGEIEEDRPDSEEQIDEVGNEADALCEVPTRRRRARSYKIQEVMKRRQVVLVQVVKEERGNKGAALTTYLSLAGRYTVLMPNTARGGGISRKITNLQDRKRLKAIAQELEVPEGMGLIIRTAGASRTKQEIKRDFEYLLRLWENIRDLTLQSTAPSLVYEEGNLIKRSIRDLYSKDIDQVIVAGEEAHKEAKSFMRMLMPSHAKNVIKYDDKMPLFARYRIEPQLNAMFSPFVQLRSGGYLVINQTEALVAVDVNSGKSTKKFSIEDTALNTNLEAAEELSRQLKLRDLAGLIVIDFIDMEEKRNNRAVERKLKECLRNDRARIQVGRISHFGLLEMSRQRLRTGVLEGSTMPCQSCQGTGTIRSTESVALAVLRSLEDNLMGHAPSSMTAHCARDVALYLLNHKRNFVLDMEARFGVTIYINTSDDCQGSDFTIERINGGKSPPGRIERAAINVDTGFTGPDEEPESTQDTTQPRDDGDRRTRRKRRRRGRRSESDIPADENADSMLEFSSLSCNQDTEAEAIEERANSDTDNQDEERQGRRRRGRRGGRRNRGDKSVVDDVTAPGAPQPGLLPRQAPAVASQEADRNSIPAASGDEMHHLSTENASQSAPPAEPLQTPASSDDLHDKLAVQPVKATDPEDDRFSSRSDDASAADAEALINGFEMAAKKDTVLQASPIDPAAADEETSANDAKLPPDTDAQPLQHSNDEPRMIKPARSPRGEPVSTAPVLESVMMTPEAASPADASSLRPARKGWWQRRFGGS